MAGKLKHIGIDVAENGFKICACHEGKKSISQKQGWIPQMNESKEYVAKDEVDLFKQLKEVLKDCSK